jgi:hypothetical protein
MRMSDVDLVSPVFRDHPAGWQSPSDVVAGFTLAWALELKERMRLSPFAPFADGVRDRLPDRYRYDSLGKLIDLGPGASGADFGSNPVARLVTLCGAWELFELLNDGWRLRPNDFAQFGTTLAFVTGGTDRPSLYQDLSANLSKCLLAVRIRRAYSTEDELDLSEQWFVTGDEDLIFRDPRGHDSLLFHFGGEPIPLGLFAHEFLETVWSTARVFVERLGPDHVINLHRDRVDPLIDLLARGGEKGAEAQKSMNPIRFRYFNYWPGWT